MDKKMILAELKWLELPTMLTGWLTASRNFYMEV